jgi:hypothetical protein
MTEQMARADELRPSILDEVEREIGLGRAAFARLAEGAETRARAHATTSRAARSAA